MATANAYEILLRAASASQDDERPPGVYFDFVKQRAASRRRRTDIAGFAGFAVSRSEKDPFRCDRYEDFLDRCPKPNLEGYLADAVRGFFANGGQSCWVATATKCDLTLRECGLESAIARLGNIDQVSMLVAPDVTIFDGSAQDDGERRASVWRAMIAQAEALRDRVALIDPPRGWNPLSDSKKLPYSPSGLAAVYWPWLKVTDERPDVRSRSAPARAVPPCGHIAGTIARRDLSRDVFAPPANMMIEGALGVTEELVPAKRHEANEGGTNVIVATPGRGVRAMGARTLLADPTDPYGWLNIRRLVAHLAEWIAEDTQWTVFEPQGEVLYRAIERTVRTILFDLWRRGGLVGETDDEAYIVRCDATTNPPEEVEQGRVICLVGLRPAVPAEMIVVRIGLAEGRVELIDREFADA